MSRHNTTSCSKSFETQETRKIGWKETRDLIGFPTLWMRIIDVLQIERMQKPGTIENIKKKIHAGQRKAL